MIDLSRDAAGHLGPGCWFSDLLHAALRERFTGGLLIRTPDGDAAAFFRSGAVVHCGGPGFREHHLGEVLARRGLVERGALARAVEQQQALGPDRPLLGALLVRDAGVAAADIDRAMEAQNEARIEALAGLGEGAWQAAPGENARIRELGVPTDTARLQQRILEQHLGERELRALADALLGRAVKLKRPIERIPGMPEPTELHAQLLFYLQKPRKPDQLERALGDRRRVRGLLRALALGDLLETSPVASAIPIPSATLVKPQGLADLAGAEAAETPRAPEVASPPPARAAPAARLSPEDQTQADDLRKLHGSLGDRNHFELLGAARDTSAADLRKLFTPFAKRYHPDAFPAHFPEEVQRMAREVSAKLNEAYQTLTSEKGRAEYLALLDDGRFKGDARKAERAREAETKARMGMVMLKKKDFRKAREYLRFAMDLDPDNGEHRGAFAWAMFADPTFDREDAMRRSPELLREAIKRSPKSAQLHVWLGEVLKASDRPKEALEHFRTALKLDPKQVEAGREVRLLDGRAKKEQDGPRFSLAALTRLFKR
jgi:curved DNA-binding protein CbpA